MWKKGKRRTIRVLKRAISELLMAGRDMREAGDALMQQGEKRNDVYRARTAVQKFWKNFGRMMTMKNETIELLYNSKERPRLRKAGDSGGGCAEDFCALPSKRRPPAT